MAIEDAMVLGRALAVYREVAPALRAYEAERRERTSQIVRRSRWIGKLDRSAHPLVVRARELAYGAISARLGSRMLRRQLAYDAGDLPSNA
jgi:2-polyprenyl-6-methoxyphenol hydroxylase-like FAD-dependent oxidoreductase